MHLDKHIFRNYKNLFGLLKKKVICFATHSISLPQDACSTYRGDYFKFDGLKFIPENTGRSVENWDQFAQKLIKTSNSSLVIFTVTVTLTSNSVQRKWCPIAWGYWILLSGQ